VGDFLVYQCEIGLNFTLQLHHGVFWEFWITAPGWK